MCYGTRFPKNLARQVVLVEPEHWRQYCPKLFYQGQRLQAARDDTSHRQRDRYVMVCRIFSLAEAIFHQNLMSDKSYIKTMKIEEAIG